MVIPLFVGRPKSIKALDMAMDAGKHILLVAQKAGGQGRSRREDLYDIGSVATVLQMLKLPDGTVKVLVEGTQRARIASVSRSGRVPRRQAQPIPATRARRTRSRRCAARCSRSSTSTSSSTRRSRRRS
jgi:ATP-dependent Lon protease